MEQFDQYNSLFDLDTVEDDDLVMMEDMVDQMYDQLIQVQPDTNLENLRIDVEVDEDVVNKINSNLYQSSEIIIENLAAQDGTTRVVESLKSYVKNVWNCSSCGATFKIGHVICPLCKEFRPINSYDNIIHNPDFVTPEEIKALGVRRK